MKESMSFKVDAKFFRDFIAFRAVNEMQQLSEPLSHLGIKGFGYQIQYFDGRCASMSNVPNLDYPYFKEKLIETSFAARFSLPEHCIFFETSIYRNIPFELHTSWRLQKMTELLKQCSLSTAVVICKNYPDYYERYHFRFSSEQENQVMPLGYQYQDFLYRFINYFQEKGKTLIALAHRNTIQLPWKAHKLEDSLKTFPSLLRQKDLNAFIQKTDFKRLYLNESKKLNESNEPS